MMLQWRVVGNDWDHRAFWGEDLINLGESMTDSRRHMGSMVPAGRWVRLQVDAAVVGLEGKVINGMAYSLYDSTATWDKSGKSTESVNSQVALQSVEASVDYQDAMFVHFEFQEEQGFQFWIKGTAGDQIRIEASGDLIHWEALGVVTVPDIGIVDYVDAEYPETGRRFYRGIVQE